ncbi:uncharacterized protein PHACADRAFT_140342 [Phanerochaete carnosa HHB-10118-sp]|uniref:Uncharacterized protein n=1 Tax=Phanerochaete carnosa (strain HHB-10118-sp) TaxID=650164 RepID=K5V6S4_PHACS|nr:uncharacterized protein PHACADRAFT_140342 [Phanerochaete carnosa HHB-10118-sp]EKM58421.1 hypothetical protein PHACADRAFT_140342 [Phanerochaete carnosa HHB-10118-sp]
MSGATGWKNRDPVVYYWPGGTEDLDIKSLNPPLAHLIQDIVLDDARQLLFVADFDRIKSYSFAPATRKRAVHTLKADTHTGPLTVLPNGRILRAGVGSALVWNVDELETHYPGEGKEYTKIGEGTYKGFENSWREEDCKKEKSIGSTAHTTLTFAESGYTPGIWRLHAPSGNMLCAEDTREVDRFECVSLDLEHGGKVAARYLGHAAQVEQISTSAEEPNTFLTACEDGHARLYDMREPLPTLTIDGEAQNGPMDAALFVHIDGLPAVFTGGTTTQSIRLWDIRAKKVVYELSTGNNHVRSLAWSATDTTLYASTMCEYADRMGGLHGYRKARIPKRKKPESEQADEDEDEEMDVVDEDDDDEYEDEDDNSDPDLMEYYDTVRWPKQAYHLEDFFGEVFDCGSDALCESSSPCLG